MRRTGVHAAAVGGR